jgi:hypothetical protein
MTTLNLSLSNVINVSVLGASASLGLPNVNSLALFSSETPVVDPGDYGIYTSASAVLTAWGASSKAYAIALAIFSQNPNILSAGGYLVIIKRAGGTEKIQTAIARTKDLVYYFGIIVDSDITGGTDFVDMTAAVQAEDKLLFFGSNTAADIVSTTGRFDVARLASKTHSRCLYYTVSATGAINMAAAYASRALSTNFSGSNTCQTMHLKALATIAVDSGLTQTALNAAVAAGVDTYPSIAGVPVVFTSGENVFFDEIYNELWFKFALSTAGFNFLKLTNSKIPQTESGIEGLKNAYRAICEQAVTNGFVGAGAWTSPDTFGIPEDLTRNITDIGYYLYSLPVALQSTADRDDRKAPLIQIAVKAQGAVHSSNVIVYVDL